jgi:hypothetical protein
MSTTTARLYRLLVAGKLRLLYTYRYWYITLYVQIST